MRGRMRQRAVAALVTMTALATVAGSPATARPKPQRPDLGVASILRMPTEVAAGGHFGVRVLVVNQGEADAPATRARLYLSRDATKSPGDLAVGWADAGPVASWRSRSAPGDIDVPGSAHGEYHVVACADAKRKVRETRESDNCNASYTTVRVIRPVSGLLVGTLDLYDSGSTDTGIVVTTWERYAQMQVTMKVRGKGDDIRVVDDGSGYSWLGEWTMTVESVPECPTVRREDEEEVGLFQYDEQQPSKLLGTSRDADVHRLRLGATMTYDVVGSLTTCDGPVPYTDRIEMVTDLDLTEVARTDDSISYRAAAVPQPGGPPAIWDSVQGTLELRLD